MRRAVRVGFTLIELLVVIGIVAILLSLLLAGVQQARAAAARTTCQNNLRQLGVALHAYHGSAGYFPPGVSYRNGADPHPFQSWNARLLPYMEQQALWQQSDAAFALDRDFRSPPHALLRQVVLPVFSCPADARSRFPSTQFGELKVAFTSYLGSPGTDCNSQNGILYLDSQIRLTDVTDGTSTTLLAGERPHSANERLGWWYAGWGQNQDGSAEMLLGVRETNYSPDYPWCPEGPYSFGPGRIANQCDAFHFWSLHAGGGHFLFADGSVHFLGYSADPVLPALSTRAGGEPASLP
jgi:prepilin-type N-terminal cleavage/methylation domain-containing protein/prepilin-type processing-associated H-X9-DG protein